MAINSSQEMDDIWWLDENYGQSGEKINPFRFWMKRNSFWLKLALVGILVAAAWLIWIIKVYPKEVRDIYSTSKVSLSRAFSSWRKCICGKQNSRQTRRRYKARGGESRVRFETEKRSPFPNKQTRPTARNPQSGPYQKQNDSNRRTRIKIVDEIYGVIVGYQDTAGPSRQGEENPQVEGQKREPYRKEFESFVSVGIQPRCHVKEEHMKTVGEARNNRDTTARSQTARSVMSSMTSTPDSHVTPDMMRMRENTHRIKQERKEAYRARKARILKALEERQYDDLSETRV